MKLAIEPVRVCGRLVMLVGETVSVGEPTVAAGDCALSAPRQLAVGGGAEYFQLPAGTEVSVQLVPATVPEQPAPMVCSAPPVLSALTAHADARAPRPGAGQLTVPLALETEAVGVLPADRLLLTEYPLPFELVACQEAEATAGRRAIAMQARISVRQRRLILPSP